MATRTQTPRSRKTTTAQTVEAKRPIDDEVHAWYETFMSQFNENNFTRTCVGWILALSTSIGIGYLIGTLMGYALIGCILTGGSLLMQLLIYAIGLYAAFHWGGKASYYVQCRVMDKSIDYAYAYCKDKAKSLFSRNPQGVPA